MLVAAELLGPGPRLLENTSSRFFGTRHLDPPGWPLMQRNRWHYGPDAGKTSGKYR